jgi:hypothetical protein
MSSRESKAQEIQDERELQLRLGTAARHAAAGQSTRHAFGCVHRLLSGVVRAVDGDAASQRRCLSPQRGTSAQPRRVLDKTRRLDAFFTGTLCIGEARRRQ